MKLILTLVRLIAYLVCLFPLIIPSQSSSQVYINEINYRAIEPLENIDFVEIYNAGPQSVNLSGWFLTGGLKYTFPSGSSLSSGSYLVIAADPTRVQNEFGISGVRGPWEGKLSSSGDKVVLRSDSYEVIDRVEYENWKEWPNVRYLDSETVKFAVSIQKLNPVLPSEHPGSWSSAVPTPKARNTGIYASNASLIPVIKSVSKSPDKPKALEPVTIRADFSNAESYSAGMTVTLEYQINSAGNYIDKSAMGSTTWQSRSMLDDGVGPDSIANDGLYTYVMPTFIQINRRLIRYRIKVTANGNTRFFPDPRHRENSYTYFAYNGHANFQGFNLTSLDTINEFIVLTSDAIPINRGVSGEYNTEGTLIYNGKIYDHILFRGRGERSRPKPNLKFKFNAEKKLALKDDCGKEYKVKKSKISLSGGFVNDPAAHGFTENIIYKILDLVGALPRTADYTQLRIIDSPTEIGVDGDFWGIYVMLEDYYSEDYFEEHGLATGNIWGHKPDELRHLGEFPNASSIGRIRDVFGEGESPPTNYDWDLVIADRIANVLYGQNANNYYGKHSHLDYYNSETQLWHTWWSDMDNAFGSRVDDNNWFKRSDSNLNNWLNNDLYPNDTRDYRNELRSVYDLLLNTQQVNYLIDMESKEIFDPSQAINWTDLNEARWDSISPYYVNNTMDNQLNWYRSWFSNRASLLLSRNTDGLFDDNIPNKPFISSIGTTALNDLRFSNSSFSDPQGNGTFRAMEWRVGEWSDPANPFYDTKCEPKYEIETIWRSGEILTFKNNFQIPPEANLKAGRTYKIRVRYKDSTNRWSHWSNARTIIPSAASPINSPLVINEIMYNPAQRYTEFIEIHNTGNVAVSLNNVKFTEGVDYDFPPGQFIFADQYIILAEDSCEFYDIHGFSPFGEYKSSLSDGGEFIELTGPYRVVLDSLTYDDNGLWPETPDEGYFSLAFKEQFSNNANASNWGVQPLLQTPGSKNVFDNLGEHGYSGIVINEIHYNPVEGIDPITGETVSGKKFEFIELKNFGSTSINLTGAFFSQGIDYYFPTGTILSPGQFLVLAEDKSSFQDRYGFAPFDKYGGSLSNEGESIWLVDQNRVLLDAVTYDEMAPWNTEPSLGIKSLALISPNLDNSQAGNWCTQIVNVSPNAENVIKDADNDSVSDCQDICPGFNDNLIGTSCDDGDPCTTGETYFSDCICQGGVYQDADNDGVCDANDSCSGVDDSIIGQACDDGDPCTIGETYFSDCICQGGVYQDADNDGVCDANDSCSGVDDSIIGQACDDGDPCTTGETYFSDCICQGGVYQDADNDGICDVDDVCAGFDDNLIGTPCNDGDPCTTGENYDAVCGCSGGVFQDADNDGVCDANDVCSAFDDALIGQACDDGDPCTIGELYSTQCSCVGGVFQDADNDGVCDADDSCAGFDDSLIGTSCDDGNACTIGETYNVLCGCSGGSFQDTDNDGVCDANDICAGIDDALIGLACEDGDPCTTGEMYNNNCQCIGGVYQDSDGDGTCDALDDSCTTIDFERFESGQGLWQSGGIDAFYVPNSIHSPYGQGSFLIRDNSGVASSISTSILNLSQVGSARIKFSFKARNLGAGENFSLQLSTNGGGSFQTERTWTVGTDFSNDVVIDEVVYVSSHSSSTVFRFICDGSINSDELYLDNIHIENCPECLLSSIETNNSIINESVYVNQMIETNGVIETGPIEYVATDYILMTPDFEVLKGAVYHAYISPCN